MAFVYNKKEVGTASRDFATGVLAEASMTGDSDQQFTFIFFADSDYDEAVNWTRSSPAHKDADHDLINAQGQSPTWKPSNGITTGPNGGIMEFESASVIAIVGLTIDGSNLTDGEHGFMPNSGSGHYLFLGCVVHDLPGDGIRSDSDVAFFDATCCLVYDCGDIGFNVRAANKENLVNCGAVGNGGVGIDINDGYLRGCYMLDNGTDLRIRFGGWSFGSTSKFNRTSDNSFQAEGGGLTDNFINVDPSTLGFTDYDGRDLTLTTGSTLRLKGPRMQSLRAGSGSPKILGFAHVDGFQNELAGRYGDRMDAGPDQPSIKAPPPVEIQGVATSIAIEVAVP